MLIIQAPHGRSVNAVLLSLIPALFGIMPFADADYRLEAFFHFRLKLALGGVPKAGQVRPYQKTIKQSRPSVNSGENGAKIGRSLCLNRRPKTGEMGAKRRIRSIANRLLIVVYVVKKGSSTFSVEYRCAPTHQNFRPVKWI
jgi:hypothetical protein